MNIVTIDNNPQNLSVLAGVCASIFPLCHIQSFTDPLLSAKFVCNCPVDMVLLAEHMYPVDGFVLLRVLRANKPNLPVVMLTEHGLRKEDAITSGVNSYIITAITAEALHQISGELSKVLHATSPAPPVTPNTMHYQNMLSEISTKETNEKVAALAQDTAFIKTLAACETTADAQQQFASKGIHLTGPALLASCLTLLKCNETSGLLSDADLEQVSAGSVSFQDFLTNQTILGEIHAQRFW